MSSEHDDSAELMGDLSVKSDAEKGTPPSEKKFQGPGEHAKPKRKGRRGKKRKQRKASGGATSENPEDPENRAESPPWDSDEDLDCEINAYNDVIIRPINVPKAPENSTQFIIDDHNECRLYMSFETPNPYLLSRDQEVGDKTDMVTEPIGEDAAYRDIDFEYDPPQDFDNSAYYDREFELSYKSNRFDELLRLPRTELISGLRVLEARLKELSDDLVKVNPSPILEQLQAQLLELQEKHFELKECHSNLSAMVAQSELDSTTDGSLEGSRCNPTPSKASDDTSMEEMSILEDDHGTDGQHVEQMEDSDIGRSSQASEKSPRSTQSAFAEATDQKETGGCEMDNEVLTAEPDLMHDSSVDCSLKISERTVKGNSALEIESVSEMDHASAKMKLDDNPQCSKRTEESSVQPVTGSNWNQSLEQSAVSDIVHCDSRVSSDAPHNAVHEECELSAAVSV